MNKAMIDAAGVLRIPVASVEPPANPLDGHTWQKIDPANPTAEAKETFVYVQGKWLKIMSTSLDGLLKLLNTTLNTLQDEGAERFDDAAAVSPRAAYNQAVQETCTRLMYALNTHGYFMNEKERELFHKLQERGDAYPNIG